IGLDPYQGPAPVSEGKKTPFTVKFQPDAQTSWLLLSYQNGKSVQARIDFAKNIVEPVLGGLPEAFDDIIIGDQHDGQVMYQQSRSGLRFTNIRSFLAERERAKTGRAEGEREQRVIIEAKLSGAENGSAELTRYYTSVVEAEIGNTTYQVF